MTTFLNRRDLDAKFHEHDDHVNHALRVVSKEEIVSFFNPIAFFSVDDFD